MRTSLEGLTLHVEDVDRSVDFYRRVPGAVLLHERPGEFALFAIGGARLGLLTRRFLPQASPGFHLELSAAEGIEELYEQVRAGGIVPDGPPRDRAWGETTFHAIDPDGNLLEFDSRLSEA